MFILKADYKILKEASINPKMSSQEQCRVLPLLIKVHTCTARKKWRKLNFNARYTTGKLLFSNILWTLKRGTCFVWVEYSFLSSLPTVRHRVGSIMVWKCFATARPQQFNIRESTINSRFPFSLFIYRCFITHHLKPIYRKSYFNSIVHKQTRMYRTNML